MAFPVVGKGAKYMVANVDSDGVPLSGAANYRIKLPAQCSRGEFLVAHAV